MKHIVSLLLTLFLFGSTVFLVGPVVVWAAQAKAPAKAAPEKEARVEKTMGTIISFTATSLVVSHEVAGTKKEITFVLIPETRTEGTLKVGAKVHVEYRVEGTKNVATVVKVHEAKPAPKTKTPKPKP